MTEQKKSSFQFIYKILLSVSIAAAGICLICGSLYIFLSGNGYSREIVLNTFSKISIPVFVCVILTIGSFFINDKSKSKFYKPKNFDQKRESKLDSKKAFIIKLIIVVAAIAAIILGAFMGGFADVLTKAVNICTECIGLG